MKLINGKEVSNFYINKISKEVEIIKKTGESPPCLAAVLIGNNSASTTYVENKIIACKKAGFDSKLIKLPNNISEEHLLNKVDELNKNKKIDGYIVQLPLPKHIDAQKILLAINPKKDVDGFHPKNFGKLCLGLKTFVPATPLGILKLLEYYTIEITSKKIAVIGRSNIVGRPISILLSQNASYGNGTVTLLHSKTKNLTSFTKQADILIVAIGIPHFLKKNMVKPNCVVIDVGINRVEDKKTKRGYRLVGDVDFDSVSSLTSYITPVPLGVGPMTIAMLLYNTLLAKTKFKTTI